MAFRGRPLSCTPRFQPPGAAAGVTVVAKRSGLLLDMGQRLEGTTVFLRYVRSVRLGVSRVSTGCRKRAPRRSTRVAMGKVSAKFGRSILPLSFSVVAHTVVTTRKRSTPTLRSALAQDTQGSLDSRRFVGSFHCSFLLVRTICNRNRFEATKLGTMLGGDRRFESVMSFTVGSEVPTGSSQASSATVLLSGRPAMSIIVSRLISGEKFCFRDGTGEGST